MQKRRELKAAGIALHGGKPKRRFLDYNNEIPFQKLAPSGFYDTSTEKKDSAQSAAQTFQVLR